MRPRFVGGPSREAIVAGHSGLWVQHLRADQGSYCACSGAACRPAGYVTRKRGLSVRRSTPHADRRRSRAASRRVDFAGAAATDPAVRTDWDAIVVGLGGIGSGAAYWLSRRLGDRVLGLEQFELGHANGASQDHSRIIRLSYHRPDYVRLAKRAYATWAEVEAESGETIVTTTGGLDVAPRDAAIPLSDYTDGDGRGGRPVRAPRRPGDQPPLAAVAAR